MLEGWFLVVVICLLSISFASSQDSCSGRCGTFDSARSCQCNTQCETFNDCCVDYFALCKQETCTGRCGAAYDSTEPCQCNSLCGTYNNCCGDFTPLCESCANKCGAGYDSSLICQCNDLCPNYGNCCNDYNTLCTSGATTSAPGPVDPGTPDTLDDVMQAMWNNDDNRFPDNKITLNPSGPRLFQNVDETLLNEHTFRAYRILLDNYNPMVGVAEVETEAERKEIDHFLHILLETKVMLQAKAFLQAQGKVGSNTDDFKNVLKELWFNLYSRSSSSSTLDSSGFEHVMVGETRGSSVTGFHSWLQFYLEEKRGTITFDSVVATKEPRIRAIKFNWNGYTKSVGSFFLGTSPEFDLGVYTVCALMHTGSVCQFNLQGASVSIQTYDINHKAGNQIGSAYPIV